MNLLRIAETIAPPPYLLEPVAGVDISSTGIKTIVLEQRAHGLQIASFAEELLPPVSEHEDAPTSHALVHTLERLAHTHHFTAANVGLPESRGYLFETRVSGSDPRAWNIEIEKKLDEHVPLPPSEVLFGITPIQATDEDMTEVVGVGYARKVVEESLAPFDHAGISVHGIESETFALPRALLRPDEEETVLIIDIGKASTKVLVTTRRVPRFVTTLDIGGHALTLAVQKYFGVTEEEAKKVKIERGIAPGAGNEEYVAAMFSTVSAIKEEIVRRLEYWESRAATTCVHEPVTRAILVGGNASVRGLPEYLQGALDIPVSLGDVFTNLAPLDNWLPPMEYSDSLGFGTAIGLALREYSL